MEPINLDNTKALERIAEAVERIAEAEARGAELGAEIVQRTGAEPAGIPILLIVEVLIALINIRRRYVTSADAEQLQALKRKLEPYLPVRPQVCLDGKEAE